MIIKYKTRVFDQSQRGEMSRGYITALSRNFSMFLDNSDYNGTVYRDSIKYFHRARNEFLIKLITNHMYYDTVVHDMLPSEIVVEKNKINIGIVTCKTTSLPTSWVDNCNKLDVIITPSEYCASAIKRSGVYVDVAVCPPLIDPMYRRVESMRIVDRDVHKFLMDIDNVASEGWVDAVYMFFSLFKKDDNVLLIVASRDSTVHDIILAVSKLFDSPPLTCSINTSNNEVVIPSVYSTADMYFHPARGIDYGINYIKALSCGLPVVCGDSGGHVEYIGDQILLPTISYPAVSCPKEPYYDETLFWYKTLDIDPSMKQDLMKPLPSTVKLPEQCTADHVVQKLSTVIDDVGIKTAARSAKGDIDVSIIILSYNKVGILRDAVTSISKAKTDVRYEVILVENGSTKPNRELFDYVSTLEKTAIKVVYQDPNIGFGPGNNLGVSYASGKYLCFLNNDTEVTDYWLEPVIKDFEDEAVGVVGVKLVYPNMTVQHVGIALKQTVDFYATHPHTGASPSDPIVNIRKDMLAVTGACLFIRKDLFQLLGGFDTVYKIGYYEDADICLRVRELGYKVIYEPDTMVVHKTGQTFKSLGGMKKLNFFVDNEAEFRRRWDNKIADNSFMFVTRHSYSPGKLNVAILNSYMETYGGGERLVTHVAKTLEDGNNVDILMRLVNRVNRGTILENTGIDLKNTDILTIMTGEPLRSVNKYDVFINSEWLSTEHGAGKKNILMTMFPNVTSNGTTGDGYINSYDSIITISKFSQHWIKRYWNKESTVIYPPVDFVCTDEERMSLRKENMILSVGRFFVGGHNKKHDVMIEAFKNLVDSGHNEWELHLVGGLKQNAADKDYFNKLIDLAGGYNVRFHTNASQREVHDLYKRSKVYWHATGYGASDPMSYEHFGIAPVEAISAGCVPVLINKGGLPEIVAECGGYLWNTISEVVGITSEISVNSKCTTVYPTVFSKDEFKKRISVAINDVVINDVVINDVVPNKVL